MNSEKQKTSIWDGFYNALTGLGRTARTKKGNAGFEGECRLTDDELTELYEGNAISARIVDRLPDDATKEGFFLSGIEDTEGSKALLKRIEDLDLLTNLADTWRWGRLYGGAIMFPRFEEPVLYAGKMNLDTIGKIVGYDILDSSSISAKERDTTFSTQAIRNPRRYRTKSELEAQFIDASWVVRFDGCRVPNKSLKDTGWGPSALQRMHTEIQQLGEALGYTRDILHNVSTLVLKLKGLRNAVKSSQDGQDKVDEIVCSLRNAINNLDILPLDSEDEIIEKTRSLSGIQAILDQFIAALVRGTDMPRTIILGEQPGGLNASGNTELEAWYGFVQSQQNLYLTAPLKTSITILGASMRNEGIDIPDLSTMTINYQPLWQPTKTEVATLREAHARTAQILIPMQISTPDEERKFLEQQGLLVTIN